MLFVNSIVVMYVQSGHIIWTVNDLHEMVSTNFRKEKYCGPGKYGGASYIHLGLLNLQGVKADVTERGDGEKGIIKLCQSCSLV